MQPAITLASGSTTDPFFVQPDGWVIIEAGSASATLQYTTGTPADITNGTATWVTAGSYTGFTAIRADEELADTWVKLTAVSGSITYHVEGELSKTDRLTIRGYKKTSINSVAPSYSLDSSGNVTGLVGPGGTSPLSLSNLLKDLVFPDAPSDKTVALSAALGFESTAVQEPSVWYYNGLYHMIYTAGTASPRLGYASATSLLGPWTKNATAVLGGGVGGLAGGAYHSFVYTEGTTGYCYFVDSTDGTLMKLATFSLNTPTVLTVQATTWALIGTGTQWGNFAILKDGSTYVCVFEQSTAANSWQLGVGTMTSPTSAITSSQFPCTSLRPSAINTTATTSAGQLFKENGQYVLFYHAGTSGSLPSYGFKATCSPTDITTWTIQNNGYPIIDKSHRLEVDQVADVCLCQDNSTGVWVAFWTAMNNVGPVASIMYAPLRPRIMQSVGGTYVSADNSANSIAQSNRIAQAPAFAAQTTDVTTTSASFANFGITNLRFIPRTNRMLVRLSGSLSNTTASTGNQFRVTDGGSINSFLASFSQPSGSGGFQCGVAGEAVISVNAGQRYTLSLQALVSGGTLQCRAATLPNAEGMTLTVSDLGSPNLTA